MSSEYTGVNQQNENLTTILGEIKSHTTQSLLVNSSDIEKIIKSYEQVKAFGFWNIKIEIATDGKEWTAAELYIDDARKDRSTYTIHAPFYMLMQKGYIEDKLDSLDRKYAPNPSIEEIRRSTPKYVIPQEPYQYAA